MYYRALEKVSIRKNNSPDILYIYKSVVILHLLIKSFFFMLMWFLIYFIHKPVNVIHLSHRSHNFSVPLLSVYFFLNFDLLLFFLPSRSSEIVSYSLWSGKNNYATFCATKWRRKISISTGILNYYFSIWSLSVGEKIPYFQRFIGDICSVYISQKREHCLSFPLISISEYLFEETFFSAPFYEGTNRADIRVTTAKVFLAFFMW